jgi:hypothetical protein
LKSHSRETITITPNLIIQVHEGDGGRVLDERRVHNIITDAGLDYHWLLLGYPNPTIPQECATPQYIVVGTGTTGASVLDTVLVHEISRYTITRRYPQFTEHAIEFNLYLSTSECVGSDLTEAGIFHLPINGSCWARATHAPIQKFGNVSVSYRWTWTYGAS